MAKYQCSDCGYVYDEAVGDPHEGFPAGTIWEKIPEDWSCPDCAVRDKIDFIALQESNSVPPVSGTNSPAAAQAKTEDSSQKKEVDTSTSSAKNKTKPKAKPKPTSANTSKDSSSTETYHKWVCITCGHIYDEALGDEAEGFPPGTRFEDIPDDWCCPDCGATKEDYILHED